MYIGRIQEQKQLEDAYASEGNHVIVVYGRYGIGKTELIQKFVKDKQSVYYAARELSEREQLLSIATELTGDYAFDLPVLPMFESLDFAIRQVKQPEKKTIVVLDEFHLLSKPEMKLQETLIRLMKEASGTEKLMFVLMSSSIKWVENEMVEECPVVAKLITGFIKLKDFTFMEMVNRFPNLPVEQTIYANAVLGGIPKYLNYWSEKRTVSENMMLTQLSKNSALFSEPERFLKMELRELGAYNAILKAMAAGHYKLNEIFARTGFSRAKISVYIKNLIEIDIVEKIFSYDAAEHANVQKGLYRIKDRFIHYWYRYVFPNISELMRGEIADVYRTKVVPTLGEYMRECFADVCAEYLRLMSRERQLAYSYTTWGTWYGKAGLIDVVAGDEQGHILVAFCNFGNQKTTYEDYLSNQELLQLAALRPEESYMFSKEGFSEDLPERVKGTNMHLVRLDEL